MSEITDLYQEVILDHNRKPRNFGRPAGANRTAEGFNPLCGDKVTVYVDMRDGRLHEVAFEGSGCAISKASASMMTEALKGRTEAEARALFETFHQLVTGEARPSEASLGKLVVFSGVRGFPMRVKCASLAWHTLRAAMDDVHVTTTTE
ncbi:MAG: Fe-S cluster assembly sulfur transfer protein SufU [Candidatus Polarisedimenticolia bacterium]